MRSGGAEKSLLTLLCFRHDGLFFNKIPKKVNLLGGNRSYEIFDGDAKQAVKYFLKKGKILSAVDRWKYSRIYSLTDSHAIEELQWKYLKKQLPKIRKTYDCAIGYLEGNANRFVAENVSAKRKICYIHNDIERLGFDRESYEKTFASVEKIVTVSEECKNSLLKNFKEFSKKISVIENITSREIVAKESKNFIAYPDRNDNVILCTVGRFFEQKNIPLAVDACAELVARGNKIKWYHIGDGPLKEQIKKRISDNGLEGTFILLGEKSQPYPYVGQCDIYVQPSLYEGKSIAIDEAKCLCRPIVVTDFTTVHDQIKDGYNGLICHMDKKDMADKIESLILNKNERDHLSDNLSNEKTGNEGELEKLYCLIDG